MKQQIEAHIREALELAVADGELSLDPIPDVEVERPRDPAHGDWSTNVAMKSAKAAGRPPREVAETIAARLRSHPDVDAVEIAGPGFINLRLSGAALQRIAADVRALGLTYGSSDQGGGRKTQVEFVSANPVGPMHVGHGRWAALGDSMARVLQHAGYEVEREFYINDAGVQMDIFAKSVAARYLEIAGEKDVPFEESWYQGAYIYDIAQEIHDAEGERYVLMSAEQREGIFRERAYAQVLEHMKRVLHSMGVDFDVWFSERTLHAASADGGHSEIEAAIARLREGGFIFEKDDAVWFRSTDFGDDKDRVLKKADGEYTYFAADIAYHWDKFHERGFDLVIDIWGADHHGYVKRMEAAVAALGYPGQLQLVIGQLVNLFRAGEAVRMSKRTGEMVTFEELLGDVGADAARYFFLRRSTDQQLDFDIELAKQQSADNPVYYVQYAHARICSILRKAAGHQTDADIDVGTFVGGLLPADVDLSLLTADAELTLLRKMGELGEVVEVAADQRAPYKLTRYAEDLAAAFHQFYTVCRVVSDDQPLTRARLALVDAVRVEIETVLALLGVTAPQRM